jgi:hypothetical protein
VSKISFFTRLEVAGLRSPSTCFHTGDGDFRLALRSQHQAQIQDAVLLGANELLPIKQKYRRRGLIERKQTRDRAALRHFCDAKRSGFDCIFQYEIINPRDRLGSLERIDPERPIALRMTNRQDAEELIHVEGH